METFSKTCYNKNQPRPVSRRNNRRQKKQKTQKGKETQMKPAIRTGFAIFCAVLLTAGLGLLSASAAATVTDGPLPPKTDTSFRIPTAQAETSAGTPEAAASAQTVRTTDETQTGEPATAPGTEKISGVCGYRATWTFDPDTGILTIDGTGNMTSAHFGIKPGKILAIRVADGITSIPDRAFEGCFRLSEILLPDSVHTIGAYALRGCTRLTTVRLPEGINRIPAGLFCGDWALETVNIPESVRVIGEDAFRECKSLKNLQLPEYLTQLGNGAFAYCTGIESLTLPFRIRYIPTGAFYGCTNLKEIGSVASVTLVFSDAFRGCSSLRSLRFSGALEFVGNKAFAGCTSLTDYTLSGKASVAPDAFLRVPVQKELRINLCADDLAAFCRKHDDFAAATGAEKFRLYVDGEELTSLLVPTDCTELPAGAFAGFVGLSRVLIPDSVRSVGAGAFAGCSDLLEVTVTGHTSIAPDAFDRGVAVKTADLLNGWVTYPGGVRYYDHGYLMDAWFMLDGKMYYATYKDKLVIDYDKSIRGKQYFWNEKTGLTLAEGVILTKNGYRYFADGRETFGWCELDGKTCYALYQSHEVIMRDYVIGGRQYVWNDDTGLTLKSGLFLTPGGPELWQGGRRVIEWGFHRIDGCLYYITYSVNNQSGTVVTSDKRIGGVDYIWTETGLQRK